MHRRDFYLFTTAHWLALLAPSASLASELAISQNDALSGLKTTLERGAQSAINHLGRPDGFLANPQVHIPLPPAFKQASKILRTLGQGKALDDLETSFNRAAEAAVPQAKPLLMNAIKSMSVSDAKQIIRGGETSVTDFFAGRTRQQLSEKFLPIVRATTDKLAIAQQYNRIADKGRTLGVINEEDADISKYVTSKALDGLYWRIGEEEKQIRRDPIGTGSKLLEKLFSSVAPL